MALRTIAKTYYEVRKVFKYRHVGDDTIPEPFESEPEAQVKAMQLVVTDTANQLAMVQVVEVQQHEEVLTTYDKKNLGERLQALRTSRAKSLSLPPTDISNTLDDEIPF